MKFFPICPEIIAMITGLIALKHIKPVYLKSLVLLLVITVINEVVFVKKSKEWWDLSRNIFYNGFSFIDMITWFYIFYKIHYKKSFKIFVLILGISCILYSVVEICFLKSWKVFHTDSLRLFNLSMIILSLIYLYQLLKKEYHQLSRDPLFLTCAACILFHSIFFINLTTFTEPKYWKGSKPGQVFFILQDTGISLYYLLICAAFISCIYYNRRLKHQASYQSLLL